MPDAANLSTPLAWALAYAERGWHVLPLEPRAKQPLGRLVPRGMLDATLDAETIRAWWRSAPLAGVGIALAPSGLVALDIDPRNGGNETFDQLQAQHGSLRSEVMAFTGGGGEHHVFVIPPGAHVSLPGTLGPGVDVKANGYIVVEPSIHPSGKAYAWELSSNPLDGVAPSPLPDWLRSLRVSLPQSSPAPGDVPVDPGLARDLREALYVLDAEDRDIWLHAGMALHSTGWGHPAYAMWCAWSQQSQKFDSTDQRKVWQSFKAPIERGTGLSAAWVFSQAQQAGWVNPRARFKSHEGEAPWPRHPDEERADARDETRDASADVPVMSLAELQAAASSVRWVIKHAIPAESVGMMFGGSGTFKSFIAVDMACHVAHGMPWLGKKTKKAPVLIVAAEGGAGLWRRIEGWHRERGMLWEDAEIYVVPVAVDLGTDACLVTQAVAKKTKSEPGVVVVDTLSQTFSGEENSATEVSGYLREIGLHFRALWRCAVLIVHHTGHQATERPRGSSTMRSNLDFMFGVFRDEREMLATVQCVKQKDGELLDDCMFALSVFELGADEDGEKVTTLVARHLASEAETLDAMQHEASRGRGGRHQTMLNLVQNGMSEKDLRKQFYEELDGVEADARKKAFYRSRDWLIKQGVIEVVEGFVIDLRRKN